MNTIRNQFSSIEQVTSQYLNTNTKNPSTSTSGTLSFEEILQEKQKLSDTCQLKFSKHALNRLSDRNISLSENQKERLEEGTQKAEEKGIRESLVIVDELAFIVNVPNQTVVTAMDQTETKDNVFTNIDGAIII